MQRKYRIHPAIGIARVGDSLDDFFIGPEAPGVLPSLNKPDAPPSSTGTYKDKQKRIKRQGARFRIYEYTLDDADTERQVREITAADAQIQWEVHLTNRKAAAPKFTGEGRRNDGVAEKKLTIDAGKQKIGGANQGMQRLQGSFMDTPVPLGDLLTDTVGRLIVLGGFGTSQSVPPGRSLDNFADNDGWCDDVSDGPVKATIRLNNSAETTEAESAWVIVAPPDFAPPIENIITLYDVVYNMATILHPLLKIRDDTPISFTSHIYPIFRRVSNTHWVSAAAGFGHGPNKRGHFLESSLLQLLSDNDKSPNSPSFLRRDRIFGRLTNPSGGGGDMPRLAGGNESVSLTEVQYKLMERWAKGEFKADWTGQPPVPLSLDKMPVQDRPHALDRAALEACAGSGLFPGIEVGRIMREQSTYDKNRPFRISMQLAPGALTARMAVPWQADFHDCTQERGGDWWPAQRPNQVFRGQKRVAWMPDDWEMQDVVDNWSKLGFVVRKLVSVKEQFVESERSLPRTMAAGKG